MITGTEIASLLLRCHYSHVVWIPDSEVGPWDQSLASTVGLKLIRPTREGEALAIAAGLLIGGEAPLVIIQCTGLFEAGDALRNFIHDLRLPLHLLVGVRSYNAYQAGRSFDSCPRFTEPILQAWQIPTSLLPANWTAQNLESALTALQQTGRAGAVLLPE